MGGESAEMRKVGEPTADAVALAFERLSQQPSVISGWFNWQRPNSLRLVPCSITALIAEQVVLEQAPPVMR